jgi:uncharacterized protein (DUF433 family)
MKLEEFFDFVSADEIRIRGTRIGIEAILSAYLDGALPEELALNYTPVTLEQVHATITYYLGNRQAMDEYLDRWTKRGDESLQRQRQTKSAVLERLIRARRPGTPA